MAPRRRGLRRRRPPLGARPRIASATWSAPTRSRSTRTSGSSRPTTSAGCWSATGERLGAVFGGRAPEYYRGGETSTAADGRERDRRPRRPAQLLQAELRGHPPLARAQAVDDLEAPRHDRLRPAHRGQRRPRRPPRRAAARRPTTSRRCRPTPELSVVCFRHLAAGPRPATPSTPTRTGSRRPSRHPATAG